MEQKSKNVSPFSNEARNTYVMEHITETVLDLMKEKNLNDISVSEICDGAGVGRTSFYRNYETKEDIVKKYVKKIFDAWREEYEKETEKSNPKLYGSLFQFLKDNSEFFLTLKRQNLLHLFLEVYMEKEGPKQEDINMWAYTKAFIAYGTYGWIEEWIGRGMQESAETMAGLLASNGMK